MKLMRFFPYVEAFAHGFLGVLVLSGIPNTPRLISAVFAGTLAAINLHRASPL